MPIGLGIGSFAEGLSEGLLSGVRLGSSIQQMQMAQQAAQQQKEEADYVKQHRELEKNLKLLEVTYKATRGLPPEKADMYWYKLREQVGNDSIMTNLIDTYRGASADRQKEINDIIKGLITSVNNNDWDNFNLYHYKLGLLTDFGEAYKETEKRRMEAVTQQGQALYMKYAELRKEIEKNPSKYVTNGALNDEGLKILNEISALLQEIQKNPVALRLWVENFGKPRTPKLQTYINPKTEEIITIDEATGEPPPSGFVPVASYQVKKGMEEQLYDTLTPDQKRKAGEIKSGLSEKAGEKKEKTMTEYRHWFDMASKEAMKRVFGNRPDVLSSLVMMMNASKAGEHEKADQIRNALEGSMSPEQYKNYLKYRDEFFSSAPGVPSEIRSIYSSNKPKNKSTTPTPAGKTVDDYFRMHK